MPPLPKLLTPSYLASIRAYPGLPRNTWYFIAGVTLSTLNRPEEIGSLLTYALENGVGPEDKGAMRDEREKLLVARRMREALVKSSAIVGLPKTINALTSLRQFTPSHLLDPPASLTTPSPTNRTLDLHGTPLSTTLHRGSHLFSAIYARIASRITHQLSSVGTEDLELLARLQYGFVLSGGNGVLSEPETSFCVIAALVPQDVNPQLKGHLRGAINIGARGEEVEAVRGVCVGICEEAGMSVGEVGGWREGVARL